MSADVAQEALFRSRPLMADLRIVDVHVNALGRGMIGGQGFYSSERLDDMLADPAGDAPGDAPGDRADNASCDRPSVVGGIAAPPAGVDLLAGSLALRDETASLPSWHAWLRLDDDGGTRPPANTLARATERVAARVAPGRSSTRGEASGAGSVSRAIAQDPDLLDGFAGVKLMPQQTGLPNAATLSELARRGTPVLVHAGVQCPVAWLEMHLLPRLTGPVVFAHLASWPCAADDLARAVALAEEDPRLYFETSGANIGNFIRHAVERVPERLLFGSNRPMCAPAVQFAHVAASVTDDAALAAIAHGNAHRLFGWPEHHEAPPA